MISVGSATIDCLMKSEAFRVVKSHQVEGGLALCEVLGGKSDATDGGLYTGGGGTNVAVGLRRLGESVKVISRLGNDNVSDLIVADLKKESVNVDLVQKGSGKTAISVVLVAIDGSRSIVTYRGESKKIIGDDVAWNEVKKAEWIQVAGLGGNMDLLEDFVSMAVDSGIKVGLNPGKGELYEKERLLRLLPKVNYISLNRMEASMLLGVDFENEEEMITKFKKVGGEVVVITDGKKGAVIADSKRWIKMEAFGNKSVDDTGAGDGFVVGAVWGIMNGYDLEEVLKLGLASGAGVVSKMGAKTGLLYKGEVDKWLKKKLRSVEGQID